MNLREAIDPKDYERIRALIDLERRKQLGLLNREWWHGTEYGYSGGNSPRCRCKDCTKVSSLKRKIRRSKEKQRDPEGYAKKVTAQRKRWYSCLTGKAREDYFTRQREYEKHYRRKWRQNLSPEEKEVYLAKQKIYDRRYREKKRLESRIAKA